MRLAFKAIMVVVLSLAILIPLAMINGTISERQMYRSAAVQTVASSYGGQQTIAGPVLVIPYRERVVEEVTGDDGVVRQVVREHDRQWMFFPETLTMDGELKPDVRQSSIYPVQVYAWNGKATAKFDVTVPAADAGAQRVIGKPWLSLGVADVGGMPSTPQLTVNGVVMNVAQGLGHADGPGVHTTLAVPVAGQHLQLDVQAALLLQGTESFRMLPLGNSNELRLHSSWPHPKFEGKSPQHDIGSDGFNAHWQIASVATNAQRHYRQEPATLPVHDSVGVSLLDPVNPYVKADRATKYGILFVVLTFVGFFMFELIKQIRVHPIQYLLVGMAIAMFFLLLVSLSEHIDFGLAYLLAALACIGLIGFYLSAVLRSRLRGLGFAAMLGTLYVALYGLLLSENNALVLGSGLLFVILAAIMVLTRKVDWYQLNARSEPLPEPAQR